MAPITRQAFMKFNNKQNGHDLFIIFGINPRMNLKPIGASQPCAQTDKATLLSALFALLVNMCQDAVSLTLMQACGLILAEGSSQFPDAYVNLIMRC